MCFLWMYASALGIGVLQIPMVFTCNVLTPPIFAAKFGWNEDQMKLNNALISSAGVVGMAIGCFLGGKAISLGRRKAAMLTQTIAFIGGCLTQVLNVPTICIGRLLYGIAAGNASLIMAKGIIETVPGELSGQFGILTNAFIAIGIMNSFLLAGAVLPTDKEDYLDD